MKRNRFVAIMMIVTMVLSGCGVGKPDSQAGTDLSEAVSDSGISEVEESSRPDEVTEPEETQKPEVPTEPEETQKPEVPTEPEETQKPEVPTEPGETQKPEVPSEPDEPQAIYTYTELNQTMWATGSVNVRTLPCTDGKKLGTLSSGDEVQVTGQCKETGWYRIRYNGQTGYVSNKYLTTEKPKAEWPEITAEQVYIPALNGDSPIIVIDAGHQEFANNGLEPNGPGATVMKKKVSRGAKGCVSDWWEYELNLVIAMKLKEELTARGYQVVMIRETHEINISNSERAKVANNIDADAFIRIHANSSNDPSEQGAFTICQTPDNPYVGDKYESYRRLADCILDGFAASTGCFKREVWETDTMSGINWAQVPTTIIEMGYMTNAEEDALMATEEYQNKMVQGIADGLDSFLK